MIYKHMSPRAVYCARMKISWLLSLLKNIDGMAEPDGLIWDCPHVTVMRPDLREVATIASRSPSSRNFIQ